DGGNGPFQTFADVIVFAAALGVKYKKRVPFEEVSKREPVPIRLEVFAVSGYDLIIKLLGITETQNIQILSPNDEEFDKQRNEIFEEYANGGLEVLQGELRGAVDYTDRILLFLQHEKLNNKKEDEEFDLTRFLS
ncbi:MAG: DNA phosphorothioation-associated protein 4, partial [Sphaerospermopsis kisseleviana]